MKCANCGTENQPNAAYCIHCGTALASPIPAEPVGAATAPTPVGVAAGGSTSGGADSTTSTGPTSSPPPSSPNAGPTSSGPSGADLMATLQNATNRLEAIMQPIEQQLTPVQNALTPLEGIGKRVLAWIGCALVLIGLFVPIKTYSVLANFQASYTYWDLNGFLAVIFLILTLAAAAFVFLRMDVWLWPIGAILLLFFILGFINAVSGGGDISVDTGSISPHPSYGWIFLFAGALAMLAAAAMRDRSTSPVSTRV